MQLLEKLPWVDPLALASGIPESEECWVLLHSARQEQHTGRYSLLALKPQLEVKSQDFSELAPLLSQNDSVFNNAWFGYLSYELRHTLENQPESRPWLFDSLPRLWMAQFSLILRFDHDRQQVEAWGKSRDILASIPEPHWHSQPAAPAVTDLASNMDKPGYLARVEAIKDAIQRGVLSQANLTRKFCGKFTHSLNPLPLFASLCERSPAPYSAFLKCNGHYVLSSSPERLVYIDGNGKVECRPIKGTSPRYQQDAALDESSRLYLEQSEKDRAENLMIVDLTRNDLSRVCNTGSVKVAKLFDVTSYATVHHMSSVITGQKCTNITPLEVVQACFPPGSMTGTPKIKAMELCAELEEVQRGIYSGAIGWFGGNGMVDLSVVIRTLITDGRTFEFQVGGAITADSEPEAEWQETLDKAAAIVRVLGLEISMLESI